MIGLMAMIFSQLAIAQSWPNRPINLVTPLATGSASDVALRIVAERLGTALGQTLLIDNQTGASGAISTTGNNRIPSASIVILLLLYKMPTFILKAFLLIPKKA